MSKADLSKSILAYVAEIKGLASTDPIEHALRESNGQNKQLSQIELSKIKRATETIIAAPFEIERLQAEWPDNSVSCTVYYKDEEFEDIKEHLKKRNNKHIKTVSFLRHSGHGFDQAPFEEITKEEYDRRVATSRLITGGHVELDVDDADCAGGACPIR